MTADFFLEQDGDIHIFKFKQSTDSAVQVWADTLDATMGNIPTREPFFILLDVTGDNVTFTPLARQESKRIFARHQDHAGYLAMLFEWRTSPYFARLFFASLGKLGFKLKYFTQAEEALNWLHKMQASHE